MMTAPLTFRLYQTIKFNRPVDRVHDIVSPGGYEIKVKDKSGCIKSIHFDFETYEGTVDEKNPTIVHCMQKNPDYDCFEDLNILDEYMLRHIISVEEWFIFTGEPDEISAEETPLVPIKIQKPMFEIISEDGNITHIPIKLSIAPDSNFQNWGKATKTIPKYAIDLYMALALTNNLDCNKNVIYLRNENDDGLTNKPSIILSLEDMKDSYDMRKTKVIGIQPYFCCEEYKGMLFTITE